MRAQMALHARRHARDAGDIPAMASAWSTFLASAADIRLVALDEETGLWEAAVATAFGGGTSGSAVTWAVNELELGADGGDTPAPLYGSNRQQLDDLSRLGAGVARHLHAEDLTWANLGDGAPVPDTFTEVSDRIRDRANVTKLRRLLETAFAERRRLIFTCIVYGGARDTALDDPEGSPAIVGVAEAYSLVWASGHLTNVSNFSFLDIRNAYELEFLAAMGTAIGELIGLAQEQITAFNVEDVIAGLEIFDLIDDRNVFFRGDRFQEGEATQNGKDWAHAFYGVASRLRAELSHQGISVPIRLPGLSSYYQSAQRIDAERPVNPGRKSAEYRVRFLSAFLAALTAEAAAGPIPASDLSSVLHVSWERHSLKEREELDYEQLGAGHIGALVGDLTRYRAILDDAGYAHTSLSVIRSGVSVNDPDTVVPFWASSLTPTWWTGLPGTPVREFIEPGRAWFQAYEVWRRLFGAAAAHAIESGWETWMSKNRSGGDLEAYGMGLRDDRAPANYVAGRAVPRPAWLAYQRLTERVGTILSARLLNPYPPSDIEYEPSPTRGLDYLVIMGARVTDAGKEINYAYLLLIDPTLPSSRSGSYSIQVNWRTRSGRGSCWQVATVPSATPTVTTKGLPVPSVEYAADAERELPHWLGIRAGVPPVLLVSSAPLEFTVTEAGAVDHGPGDPDDGPVLIPLEPPVTVWYTPENADEPVGRWAKR
ncbi:MAG: hypothetical protein Q8P41_29745 [Pseudomonadota bacterium]|nr:hypothetical protein [Pseudomonadota bacterium]